MTNYAPDVILECSLNARDLGGIPAADGLRVQSGRLIRSGELSRLSPNDERYLRSIGLHTVIDLRTDNERELKSDRQIDGVLYMHLPVIEGLLPGITRESIEDPYKAFSRPDYAEKLGSNGFAVMRSLYPLLVESDSAIKNYSRFFRLLESSEQGAVLWHCAMGKDRAGIASALILHVLGASMDSIVEDYLLTGTRCADEIRSATEACREFTNDDRVIESVYWLNTTSEEYLAAAFDTMVRMCGSVDEYIRQKLGVTEERKQRLRRNYLI